MIRRSGFRFTTQKREKNAATALFCVPVMLALTFGVRATNLLKKLVDVDAEGIGVGLVNITMIAHFLKIMRNVLID